MFFLNRRFSKNTQKTHTSTKMPTNRQTELHRSIFGRIFNSVLDLDLLGFALWETYWSRKTPWFQLWRIRLNWNSKSTGTRYVLYILVLFLAIFICDIRNLFESLFCLILCPLDLVQIQWSVTRTWIWICIVLNSMQKHRFLDKYLCCDLSSVVNPEWFIPDPAPTF